MSEALRAAAAGVLRGNDTGTLVKAGPRLYPHQWSWDAAFISIGLAHLDVPRALTEWRTILGAQWSTGMLPHIVFDADEAAYYPGFEAWGTKDAAARPAGVRTSGICQPPVHATCLEIVHRIGLARGGADAAAVEAFLPEAVRGMAAWHEWLSTARNREGLDLVEIRHGWESGMDNSPRFDPVYDRMVIEHPQHLPRTDLQHADASERPSDHEYQRYIRLIDQMISVAYDDDLLPDVVGFRVGDVFMTAALALSADALARLADHVGDAALAQRERARALRARDAVEASIDPTTGLCRDHDHHADAYLDVASIAGFSLLVCGGADAAVARQRATLLGPVWMGHPDNRHRLPGSISLDDSQVRPREYWRGPVWPITTWYLAHAAALRGDAALASDLRAEGLAQLAEGSFGEYYEPRTGEPLGSHQQSWTAMAALDWLSD